MKRALALIAGITMAVGLAACTTAGGGGGTSGSPHSIEPAGPAANSGSTAPTDHPATSEGTQSTGDAPTSDGTEAAEEAAEPADATLATMVRLVPRSAVGDEPVLINLYWKAAAAGGVPVPPTDTLADHRQYAWTLTGDPEAGIGVMGSDLANELVRPPNATYLAFTLPDIAADIEVGGRPQIGIAARGTFDVDALDGLFRNDPAWTDGFSTPDYHGHTVYRWMDDLTTDLSRLNTGLFTESGGSRRMAFPDASTFLFGRDDATMHALLDTTDDPSDSLASDPDVTPLVAALDEHQVYSAMIVGPQTTDQVPVPSQLASRLAPTEGAGLRPYLRAGIGQTIVHGEPRTVVVLANDDAETAAANAEALRSVITQGTSVIGNRPWSDVFGIDDITTEGRLTIGLLTLTEPARITAWYQAVRARDTLLAIAG